MWQINFKSKITFGNTEIRLSMVSTRQEIIKTDTEVVFPRHGNNFKSFRNLTIPFC